MRFIALVPARDRITAPEASPVMPAFTHVSQHCPSRFSNGSYYAANTLTTAIEETKYHRAKFLAYTNDDPGENPCRFTSAK